MIRKLKIGTVKQRVFALIIAIAVLVYAVYHVASLFGEDISTIASGISTQNTVLDGKGYVFRDETALYSEYTGVAQYLREDGSKVSIGEELAVVSENGNAASKSTVKYLDDKIAILEKSVDSGLTLADLPEVNADISESYYALAKMLAAGDTGSISAEADKLLYSMNCHSILVDEESPVDNTLEVMKGQREGVFSGSGRSESVYASDSGYFYSYVDGYEEYCTTAAADSITAEQYYKLATGEITPDARSVSASYGKLAESSEWRFVVRMPETSAGYFKVGESYDMQFVENGNTVIPMTLTVKTEDDVSGGSILVFFANRTPSGFVFDRCQSVSVTVDSVSGIYVPRSAVHRTGGEYCVYVLRGSVVTMRKIDVIYETKDYYLSATDLQSDGGLEYLGTNELLIVKGNNLFDGRILD